MKLTRILTGFVVLVLLAGVCISFADAPRDIDTRSLDAFNTFLYEYNTDTTRGFATLGQIDGTAVKAALAMNQFFYDYNVNTTHGFKPLALYETISHAEAETMYLPFTFADYLACKKVEDEIPLAEGLAMVCATRFIDAYVSGTLR